MNFSLQINFSLDVQEKQLTAAGLFFLVVLTFSGVISHLAAVASLVGVVTGTTDQTFLTTSKPHPSVTLDVSTTASQPGIELLFKQFKLQYHLCTNLCSTFLFVSSVNGLTSTHCVPLSR